VRLVSREVVKIGIASDFAYIEVKAAKTSKTVAGTWRATNREVKLKSPPGVHDKCSVRHLGSQEQQSDAAGDSKECTVIEYGCMAHPIPKKSGNNARHQLQ
jgi:hypothetical protein